MAKRNYKYNATVDLSNVPRTKSGKNYMWRKSIGCIVPFTFDNGKLVGEFEIVDYKTPEGLMHPHIYLKYNGNLLKPISPMGLTNATFSNILDEYYIEWEYNIGDRLVDDERDITIIDRKRIEDIDGYLVKRYKILCNRCGFDSGEYYINGEYREEWWVTEQDLKRNNRRRVNCPCCSSRITVPGINNIPTTDPWMIPYFQGGEEEAKKYTSGSITKIFPICPYCNDISKKQYKISDIKNLNGFACVCNDSISYPNKYAYYFFKQLNDQYENYINEYSPEWAGRYKYDNYIVKTNNEQYIVEMDGGIGHGHKEFKTNKKDTEGIKRDKIKDDLANSHGIRIIRVDCLVSNSEYIKNNLIKELHDIFDLSNINWTLIDLKCHNNIYKQICDFLNQHKDYDLKQISSELKIGIAIVRSAVKVGIELGWCAYEFLQEKRDRIFNEVIEYWNNHDCGTSEVSKKVGASQSGVIEILKRANELGLCKYDPKEEMRKATTRWRDIHEIYVYDRNFNLLKKYNDAKECENNSIKDFGVQFDIRQIYNACNKKTRTHRGYIFSYEPITEIFSLERNLHKTPVYVYDAKLNYLGFYNSHKECEDKSLEDFGIKFNVCNISLVCSGKSKHHKGFIFSHTKLHND